MAIAFFYNISFKVLQRNGNADDADRADDHGFISANPLNPRHPRSHHENQGQEIPAPYCTR
jgi:hypothetical protein